MDFKKFSVYSFIGSIPWCFALAYMGVILGDSWAILEDYWLYFDIATVLGVVAVIAYFGYKIFFKKNTLEAIFKLKN